MVDAPSVYCHTIRPLFGSTATIPLPDCNATSVEASVPFTITGEVQLAILGRSSFHKFKPVFASRPALKDSLSFSTIAINTPSATVNDDDMPRLLLAFG